MGSSDGKSKGWLCCGEASEDEEEIIPEKKKVLTIGKPFDFRREDIAIEGLSTDEHAGLRERAVADANRMFASLQPIVRPDQQGATSSTTAGTGAGAGAGAGAGPGPGANVASFNPARNSFIRPNTASIYGITPPAIIVSNSAPAAPEVPEIPPQSAMRPARPLRPSASTVERRADRVRPPMRSASQNSRTSVVVDRNSLMLPTRYDSMHGGPKPMVPAGLKVGGQRVGSYVDPTAGDESPYAQKEKKPAQEKPQQQKPKQEKAEQEKPEQDKPSEQKKPQTKPKLKQRKSQRLEPTTKADKPEKMPKMEQTVKPDSKPQKMEQTVRPDKLQNMEQTVKPDNKLQNMEQTVKPDSKPQKFDQKLKLEQTVKPADKSLKPELLSTSKPGTPADENSPFAWLIQHNNAVRDRLSADMTNRLSINMGGPFELPTGSVSAPSGASRAAVAAARSATNSLNEKSKGGILGGFLFEQEAIPRKGSMVRSRSRPTSRAGGGWI